jgi:hypothetical protein
MDLSISTQKILRQQQDIFPPLTQWGQLQDDHRQPVIQVGPKSPRRHLPAQLHLRRGDQLHIHGPHHYGPQPPHPLPLRGREQLALQRQRQRLDLIQEQGPGRRRLKQAGLGVYGIAEGSGLKAEQFGLQQGLRNGRAIDLDEGATGARAPVMDDPRHQSLARPRFSLQQDGGDFRLADTVEGGEMTDLGVQRLDCGGLADELVSGSQRYYGAWTWHSSLRNCAGEGWPPGVATNGQNGEKWRPIVYHSPLLYNCIILFHKKSYPPCAVACLLP